MAQGVRADVSIEGDALVVRPHGVSKLAAIRLKLTVPLESIASVALVTDPKALSRKPRAFGTWIPGRVLAGVMGMTPPRAFWVVGVGRPLIALTLRNYKFAQIVFSTDDPEAAQQQIERVINQQG